MTPDTLVRLPVCLARSFSFIARSLFPRSAFCLFLSFYLRLVLLTLTLSAYPLFFLIYPSPNPFLPPSLPPLRLPPLWHILGGICAAPVYRSGKRFGLDYRHHDTTAFTRTDTHTHTLARSLSLQLDLVLSLRSVPAQIMKINVCFGRNGLEAAAMLLIHLARLQCQR